MSKPVQWYESIRPSLTKPASCIPSELTSECRTCARLSGIDAINNKEPVIDATKVDWPDGVCPMFVKLLAQCLTVA